jgi:Tfp pilus assembly protein PilF
MDTPTLAPIGRLLAPSLLLSLAFLAPALSAPQSAAEGEARFSMGITHLKEGRVEMALEEFKRAVKANPKNPYFRRGLGQAYAAKREWGNAIEELRKALQLNPYYVDVRNDLGTALLLSGNRDAGKKEFLAAFSEPTNPTPEISARNLGQAYLEEKNYAEAATWFRTALARNKSYADPYEGLAQALAAQGRMDGAVAQLEVGIKESPQDASLRLALGQAYQRVGRFSDAKAMLEEALRLDPAGAIGRAAAAQIKTLPR